MIMYLVVRESLNMSPGKMAAQVGHGVQLCMQRAEYLGRWNEWRPWIDGEYGKIVLRADEKDWAKARALPGVVVVVDNGHTELSPGTETVLAFPPMLREERPTVLKRLRLL